MDWNDLRYFLALARAGTLAKAARELGVEHTTVGRRIAALESALEVRLFVRGPGGFTLSAAGAEILPNVEAISDDIEGVRRRVTGHDSRVAGSVRLTMPASHIAYFIQQLTALRELHPELTLDIVGDNRALDLRRGEADVAVRFRDGDDQDLLLRKVGTAGWSLYASEDYIARKGALESPEALGGHDVIGFDTSMANVTGALWLRAHAADAKVVLRGNNVAAVASAAVAGFGLAPLPCFDADSEPALIRMTPYLIGSRDIHIAVHPDLARVQRVRATIEFLVEVFKRDAQRWSGVQAGP